MKFSVRTSALAPHHPPASKRAAEIVNLGTLLREAAESPLPDSERNVMFVSHASNVVSISEKTSRLSSKLVEKAHRFISRLPIAPVCDRIARDFERGIGVRSLGASYQCRVAVIEEVLRLRLRELEASGRARVIEMRPAMRKAA